MDANFDDTVLDEAKLDGTEPDDAKLDQELIDVATELAARSCHGDNHTVASAARAADGRIVSGVNVYHFTGGPCAELVTIGAAATAGLGELSTIVAVGDGGRGVIAPCGRCRQVLLDYFPEIRVIVPTGPGAVGTVPVRELLAHAYVWHDHQEPKEPEPEPEA
ncbi:cytidine deaminase family protein [Streptomyces indicus]|uniref:Cytidine deaminase n=1 Tax=Streptomyces indicus TaxID=417292 RepID=A0A1G8WCB5_9ACTN|nr:cytidine deaminase [Streptomyces indicus]SDJ75777.1 cytidine deaminase [Streptomyces indicus]